MRDDRYDLEVYMKGQIKLLEDGNQADHKPTYDAEIQDLKQRCERLYQTGQTIISSLSEKELKHCRLVFQIQECTKRSDDQQRPDDFCEMRLEGELVIARRYLSALLVTREFSKVLT